uniref:Uncharacterized protein n=1 Tax=Glossina pallidipes TaxID=7398 RepID=A0A1A9Z6C9_GLOPL
MCDSNNFTQHNWRGGGDFNVVINVKKLQKSCKNGDKKSMAIYFQFSNSHTICTQYCPLSISIQTICLLRVIENRQLIYLIIVACVCAGICKSTQTVLTMGEKH